MDKYLALDLGGSYLKAAIIDEKINILEKWKVESSKIQSADEMLQVFDNAIKNHLEGVKGIGLSLPGRINVKTGVMETAGWFDKFMRGYKIVENLETRYKLPVKADNDGKCAAAGELLNGALKDVTNGIVYVIGTAIGGGIVINHEVYRGSNFASGEFSQLTKDIDKEAYHGGFVSDDITTYCLLRKYEKEANLEKEISGEEFFELIKNNDELAVCLFKEFSCKTANCLYNLQTAFDVETIAIGGGISNEEILIKTIDEELGKLYQNYGFATIKPKIIRCKHGNDANLIGAIKDFIINR